MKHTILFTGHMIDAAERKAPRFPSSKEDAAREAIAKKISQERELHKDELLGIAGAASGGDILFHELCYEMGIASQIYLALPQEDYKEASVSFAGKAWENRFDELMRKFPVQVLEKEKHEQSNIWERANLWMLHQALSEGGENMTLIALWDGKGGDGEGGTEHMVKIAKAKGAKIEIVNVNEL